MKESELCREVEELVKNRKYDEAEKMTAEDMMGNPHSPVPHNLMGVILEFKSDHAGAMKHFRAANALDPSYVPARYNMDYYGGFSKQGNCVFTAEECPGEFNRDSYKIQYDERGIGHIVRRNYGVGFHGQKQA